MRLSLWTRLTTLISLTSLVVIMNKTRDRMNGEIRMMMTPLQGISTKRTLQTPIPRVRYMGKLNRCPNTTD